MPSGRASESLSLGSLPDDEETQLFQKPYRKRAGLLWKCLNSLRYIYSCSCITDCWNRYKWKEEYYPRLVSLGRPNATKKYPNNAICNQKYSVLTFVPLILFHQFKYFLNSYFLFIAITQLVPALRNTGPIWTTWAPLAFVVLVTMVREGIDDFRRYLRDNEINGQVYRKITTSGVEKIRSRNIKVSDLIAVEKNQRIPADMVLVRTSEQSGSVFIRTDQLDGETDWKLRVAVQFTQSSANEREMAESTALVFAEKPNKNIYDFVGTFTDPDAGEVPLVLDNTMWANTVVASGSAVGLVVYTGKETKSSLNTSQPGTKVGLIDLEINFLTKILFLFMLTLTLVLMSLKGFNGPWLIYTVRFIVLFSAIIPISMRVNLDMGKVVYSWFITYDKSIPGTVVRSSTIPEELGRIQYLLTDKTGTLTQNEMQFKKLHVGTVAYGSDSAVEVSEHLLSVYNSGEDKHSARSIGYRLLNAVRALALCHNVTPTYEEGGTPTEQPEAEQFGPVVYQASSPDEIALVSWSGSVGLSLVSRTLTTITLRSPTGVLELYTVLIIFPFTSESKRMGIIVRNENSGEITFYMKGADVVMENIVEYNDWLEEESGNMAREGLRTLVVARKRLTTEEFQHFESRYNAAKLSIQNRSARLNEVRESLESGLELLCLTGVEDRLQTDVRPTLEALRNAGIKVWMLTGDKLETATCIARSSRLISRSQSIYTLRDVDGRTAALNELNKFRSRDNSALVVKGDTMDVCLRYYEEDFMTVCSQATAVVVCRCSPTQKAQIVRLIREYTGKITCAVGDGGNDVSMIQESHCGIGITGKEGMQASLASDFSITQFQHIKRLLLVHGRNSYLRSATLSQFVIHRGLIITIIQAIFSSLFYFVSISLYQGLLLVGYATIFTMFPVFSLVLDMDVTDNIAMTYPELYKELTKGRLVTLKTFTIWVLVSMYQGGTLMYGALLLFGDQFIYIVSISYTSLILTELIMVALTVHGWHWAMIVAEILSVALYIGFMFILKGYFAPVFMTTLNFVWKVAVITSVSCVPLYIMKIIRYKWAPTTYSKLK